MAVRESEVITCTRYKMITSLIQKQRTLKMLFPRLRCRRKE